MVTERDLRFLEFDPVERRSLQELTGLPLNRLNVLVNHPDDLFVEDALVSLVAKGIITGEQSSRVSLLWERQQGVTGSIIPKAQDAFARPSATGRFTDREQRIIDERQFMEDVVTDLTSRTVTDKPPAESLSSVFKTFADEVAGGNANFRSFLDRQFPATVNRFGARGQEARDLFTKDFDAEVAKLQLQQLSSPSFAGRTKAGAELRQLQERGRQTPAEDPFLSFLKQGQFREQFQNLAPEQRGVREQRFKPRTRFFRF